MEFRIKEENSFSDPKEKRGVMGFIIVFVLISIFVADDWQQKRFAIARSGYEYMKVEQYNEAITTFEDYLDVNSRVYWFIVEFINNENYSRQGVISAIQECNNKQMQITYEKY